MALDGSYRVTVELMGNEAEGTVTLRTNGTKLEGTVNAMGLEVNLLDGKAAGDAFSGAVEGQTPLGQMRFKVKGSVSGDSISGKLSSGLIKADFKGVRI